MQFFGKAAEAAAGAAGVIAGAQGGPPPKPQAVWCIWLRRNPVVTKEDEPAIETCEKVCWKILLIPLALITYVFGWILYAIVYFIGCVCCPLVGPHLFTMLATARLQRMKAGGGTEGLKNDIENAMCCAKYLVKTALFAQFQMILPLSQLCDW